MVTTPDARVARALGAADTSVRLQAALAAGTRPDPALLDVLVARCGVEPDFFVRDMLTWALVRLPVECTLPRLRDELGAASAQTRSQALHTLSKINDGRAWPWVTRALLHDPSDEVARTAWRTAVVLVPDDERATLAADLVTQLGRGGRDLQRSLTRALVDLGAAATPALARAEGSTDPTVAVHARATVLLGDDPDAAFDDVLDEARRTVRTGRAAGSGPAAACTPGPADDAPTRPSVRDVERGDTRC